MQEYKQLSFLETIEYDPDPRAPVTVTWNLWSGCTKVSPGCAHCYMYRKSEDTGKAPAIVRKAKSFKIPVSRLRTGNYKGRYKIPSGSLIYTCFTSDFFHKEADDWRPEAWDMIRERKDCTFFMITKRPELTPVDLSDHFKNYPGFIESVSVGGESDPDARPCDYSWVTDLHRQCLEYQVSFSYHQTGAKLIKDGKLYIIPRKYQHEQARKANLDFCGDG